MLTMINLFGYGIGNKVEKLCDLCNITVNKNVVFSDSSALSPGGVRIGTLAMTSRGLVEKDFEQIAEFLHRSVTITLEIQKEHGRHAKKRLRSKNSVLPY
ncbi:Serine hydroxymethyltransferase 4 [Camellia lanceoleosa]|uniref:Serine hydroxymethyltransferase 4 n=1 Tax=Camellia lanceoleosa TaxID=1840588 RepID=A0ACC0GH91_9ERIC|nr:Serine hydroxymethyltransferase 4 [Camellia lanceoleosa]